MHNMGMISPRLFKVINDSGTSRSTTFLHPPSLMVKVGTLLAHEFAGLGIRVKHLREVAWQAMAGSMLPGIKVS